MRCMTLLIVLCLVAVLVAACSSEEVEPIAVSGSAPCVDVPVVGEERGRYECEERIDDQRVSGASTVLLYDVNLDTSPVEITGAWILANSGGGWEGDWTGVIEDDGLHNLEGVMIGSGGYQGLVYRVKWEYYDLTDITATGTIAPAP